MSGCCLPTDGGAGRTDWRLTQAERRTTTTNQIVSSSSSLFRESFKKTEEHEEAGVSLEQANSPLQVVGGEEALGTRDATEGRRWTGAMRVPVGHPPHAWAAGGPLRQELRGAPVSGRRALGWGRTQRVP
eukprot:GHVU01022674.1.p1 GENE.GHVU01022674.1~~GHVU01022674.1.p1  ORF type:complete len:130 (+),score=21.76 GHVU01022674.1:392-781(+)